MPGKLGASRPVSECHILVTPTSFGRQNATIKTFLEKSVACVVYNPTNRPLKALELQALIPDIDGYIAGLDEIDASVIERSNRLRVIARYGVGIDNVDLEAATYKGIIVTNTPGANSVAVAELAIGLILALARLICLANQAIRSGEWPRYNGTGLRGNTAGLIGLGSIGREVAVRLQAFGCRVLAADPFLSPEQASSSGASLVPLSRLLEESDFVSLHAPLLESTVNMVDKAFLNTMKPGAFLINTARGELVDEAALLEALESGRLRGAALDCFRQEPPSMDHPLLKLPQVILTPHSGSHTDDAVNQMGRMAVESCLAALRGNRPPNVVNPQVFIEKRAF